MRDWIGNLRFAPEWLGGQKIAPLTQIRVDFGNHGLMEKASMIGDESSRSNECAAAGLDESEAHQEAPEDSPIQVTP